MNLLQRIEQKRAPAHVRLWIAEVYEFVYLQTSKQHLSINDLAAHFALSERQLQRKIRGITDLSPHEFIRVIRLERARALIEQGQCATVQRLAYQVGYKRADYFSNLFEGYYGVKPSTLLRTF